MIYSKIRNSTGEVVRRARNWSGSIPDSPMGLTDKYGPQFEFRWVEHIRRGPIPPHDAAIETVEVGPDVIGETTLTETYAEPRPLTPEELAVVADKQAQKNREPKPELISRLIAGEATSRQVQRALAWAIRELKERRNEI
jgi:hypothetical protein